MRRVIILISAIFVFFMESCILPSEEDLFENGQHSIVIEGRISNNRCEKNGVNVTKSVDGDSEKDFEPINDAEVLIVNLVTNETTPVEFSENGHYSLNDKLGIPGETYNLEIYYDGMLYKATEKMPSEPDVSSFVITYQDRKPFEPGFYVYFTLKKRLDTIGYYKIEINVNDSSLNGYDDLIVFDDRLYNDVQLYKIPMTFNALDTIQICVHALTKNIYKYYLDLSKQSTNLFSNIQPPAINPDNNIQPDALGYFQASSVFIVDTIIPSNYN